MPLRYWLLIILLGAVWGCSFLFNAVLIREISPLWVSAGRVTIGAAICWVVFFATRKKLPTDLSLYPQFLFLGIINYSVPFALFPFERGELDWRPAINEVIGARKHGIDVRDIARMFHRGLARGIASAALHLAAAHQVTHVVLSGGVFQNALLSGDVVASLAGTPVQVLTNSAVPPNDGGISLGQAAIAALWRSACTEGVHGDA